MQRNTITQYLLFDANCAKCTHIADFVYKISDKGIITLSIHSKEAIALLDQAYPNGWQYAPYLVQVDHQNNIRAKTGARATLQLSKQLGLRKSWATWNFFRKQGVSGYGL